jgi:hypothetical protein
MGRHWPESAAERRATSKKYSELRAAKAVDRRANEQRIAEMSTSKNRVTDADRQHPSNDESYYYDRAEIELERAIEADHPGAVKAHYLLAELYLDRFYG